MKLYEVWDRQEIFTYLKTSTNEFLTTAGQDILSDSIFNATVLVIEAKLSTVFNCDTLYSTKAEGIACICNYIKRHQLELMVEITSLLKGLKKQDKLSKSHQQMSFNPINNEDIDNAPVSADTTVFNWAEALLMNTQFILQNSAVLDNLYQTVLNDVYLIGARHND